MRDSQTKYRKLGCTAVSFWVYLACLGSLSWLMLLRAASLHFPSAAPGTTGSSKVVLQDSTKVSAIQQASAASPATAVTGSNIAEAGGVVRIQGDVLAKPYTDAAEHGSAKRHGAAQDDTMPLVPQKLSDRQVMVGAEQQAARQELKVPKQPEQQKQQAQQAAQQVQVQAAKQEQPQPAQKSSTPAQVPAELQEKPADGLCGNVSQHLFSKWAVNNTVMLVLSDWSTTPLLFPHWLGNIKAAGLSYWLAAAKDKATSRHYVDIGLYGRCFNYLSNMDLREKSADYTWSGTTFAHATWLKVHMVREVVNLGFNVILSDTDVMWMKDPMAFIGRFPEVDVMMSVDDVGTATPANDTGLERVCEPYRNHNTGVYFIRSKDSTKKLLDTWIAYESKSPEEHDQEGFNRMLQDDDKAQPFGRLAGNEGVALYFNQTVALAMLPMPSFLNSYTLGVVHLDQLKNAPAYEVHLVWGYGEREGKLYRLRDLGLAHDPPEYYTEGRYMSFDMSLPSTPEGFSKWGLHDPYKNKRHSDMDFVHNRALDYQLQQLYHAMGIAVALNRTLVMPRMLCFCALNWFETVFCRLPPDNISELPFNCTGDHVFNMAALLDPPMVGNVKLQVRTPHFILDSRTALIRKSSVLVVEGTPDCPAPSPSPVAAAGAVADVAASPAATTTVAAGQSPAAAAAADGGSGPGSGARRSRLLAAEAGRCVQEKLLANTTLLQAVMSGVGAPGGGAPQHKELVVPQGLTGEEVKELLGKYDNQQWLHFSNVTHVFSRFALEGLQQQFDEMLKAIIVPWCCRNQVHVAGGMGLPEKHWHVIRPWGSKQIYCVRPHEGTEGEGTVSYFCDG